MDDNKKEVKLYQIIDGKKVQIEEEIEAHTFTEHSLQLNNLGELYYRMFSAGINALQEINSTFITGAILRLILDSTAILFMLANFNEKTQKRFIKHFKDDKPVDKFILFRYKDDEGKSKRQYLTTGYIRSIEPKLDKLYSVLNEYSHPSKMYYDKIIKLEGNSLFVNREVPKVDITGLKDEVINCFVWIYDKYMERVRSIVPKSDKYRIVYYSDTLLEFRGKEPVPLKVYEF